MCDSIFEDEGAYRHMRHDQEPEELPKIQGEPMLHPFWAAGFSFARGHFVVQVPYDQYLPMIFQGELCFVTVALSFEMLCSNHVLTDVSIPSLRQQGKKSV